MSLSRNRRVLLLGVFGAALLAMIVTDAFSQRGRRGGRNRFNEMERAAISRPFVGVTRAGEVEPGVFSISASGVSTQPVVEAARAFLSALTGEMRERASFAVEDSEWRRWANQHSYIRQGVSFEEMDETQREAAFSLLRSALSAKGFQRSRDIMRLNYSLGEITGNFAELDEWFYYMTVMGEPSEDQPWGWQIDGHHLIVNYFVLGDQVVMTPTFMGSEPVIAESGKYKGVSVMQDELKRGLALMQSLDDSQRTKALLATSKDGNNALAEAFKDNLVLDYAGILASELASDQQNLLLQLVEEFVGNMDEGHARVKMDEVKAHLNRTYFAWVGGYEDGDVFYYRVHSPVILIEFDHQRPIFMRLPRVPTLQHVHSVVRTPNGNDYGKDLLRQHYERSHRAALASAF